MTVSESYGGQGGNQLDLILMGLALGYHSQSLAITPGAAMSLGLNLYNFWNRCTKESSSSRFSS